jgi:hypothetical protein
MQGESFVGYRCPLWVIRAVQARRSHRQLHQAGDEVAWWDNLKINALETAKGLWEQTHPKFAAADVAMPAPSNDKTNPIPAGPQ